MANKTATCRFAVSYPGSGSTISCDVSVAAPFAEGARVDAGIDIPDAAAADTEYELSFGSVSEASALFIENKSGQDVHVRLNGQPASVEGVLVAGQKTMTLNEVAGERLSVESTADAGTPGVLSVQRTNGTTVAVKSWLAGTGIETADISTVKVWQGGSPQLFRLATGGKILIAMPAGAGGSPIVSASVVLSDVQSGEGNIAYKVFGDPA